MQKVGGHPDEQLAEELLSEHFPVGPVKSDQQPYFHLRPLREQLNCPLGEMRNWWMKS